jgi:hypothetical protein
LSDVPTVKHIAQVLVGTGGATKGGLVGIVVGGVSLCVESFESESESESPSFRLTSGVCGVG